MRRTCRIVMEQAKRTCSFAIPELPRGKLIRFVLCNSWDDPHFIGLNAIELFNSIGDRPQIDKMKTNANITRGSLDNVFKNRDVHLSTNDPRKMWSARYDNLSELLYIEVQFIQPESIAMIRIWNYNESRVHALRGVHVLRIELDGVIIFQGEISCAFTSESVEESMGDVGTILFTTNDTILELVAENDKCLREDEVTQNPLDLHELANNLGVSDTVEMPSALGMLSASSILRPATGDRRQRIRSTARCNDRKSENAAVVEEKIPKISALTCSTEIYDKTENNEAKKYEDIELPLLKVFHMELLENWGAPDCIGLAGLQFLDPYGVVLDNLDCSVITSTATQTSQRLLNGRNLTRNREDMWLTSYSHDSPPTRITITFAQPTAVSGICVWNYNASPEMSYAGVRCMQIYVNGKLLQGPILLRKAPGYIYFDYVQDIIFNKCILYRPVSRPQTYSVNGFTYQLQLHCTWGDEYYIGLNGIEFYNHREELIKILPQNIAAFPESVNILPSVSGDPRTSEKLIDGCNDTENPSHMWLTPILPNRCARVFVVFNTPTSVSHVNVYNYRKTPERGTRLITISVDDLIIFSGEVPRSTPRKTGEMNFPRWKRPGEFNQDSSRRWIYIRLGLRSSCGKFQPSAKVKVVLWSNMVLVPGPMSEETDNDDSVVISTGRRKKGVKFENVKIYLFERTQGFDVVPSSGGFALGMQKKHFDMVEVALCRSTAEDNMDKSEGSSEQVCVLSTRHKRRYSNTFDENFSFAKKRRISNITMNRTISEDDQAICDVIRENRKCCGCSCGIMPCSPEVCECAKNGIECLVDRPSFPCTCTAISCRNPFGRREFNEAVVRAHFFSTLMRIQATQKQKFSDMFSAIHLRFDNQ
uniref:KATNIP domain-containing protein n=1 Tax=Setaria digitata TaxID=48799 RepID=A0A915PT46_9BILA